ncbi:hypothetical protein KP004_18735 [Geomonas oryzisoli]|uniref:VWFD domain-containing protein n=1 Tax=Geomonas oryzisoli TaxID=2847992 RepID=A0ABX8J6G5_9BACT|nr:hypothetical protein [Geomonas oryzisoli]QWV93179.1 hypothetical protein KP004_18735 [Geomonas oryzisoli]
MSNGIGERKDHRGSQQSGCTRLAVFVSLCLLLVASLLASRPAGAQEQEPIAATGHGGFFAPDGHQIPVTLDFAAHAQDWYRKKLTAALSPAKKREFASYERKLRAGLDLRGQDRLILQHQALEWLLANTRPDQIDVRTVAKLRALRYAMEWKLPDKADLKMVEKAEPFVPRRDVLRRIESLRFKPFKPPQVTVLSATVNSGQAYLAECSAAGVPTPPTINVMDPNGTNGWKSQGFIPQSTQFIVGSPAEVRTYKSSAPEGMCYALPRYTDATLSTVALDGVICIGKQSSKACFWDNQWTVGGVTQSFSFPAGTQIPIGVPTTAGGKYQAGGKEIEPGAGGICTDCHAGENPYIIHPNANLASGGSTLLWGSLSGAPQNLPSMPVYRYDPLVGGSWPQNQLSQAGSTLPSQCSPCHVKGSAGRFPHLSNKLPSYCGTILTKAFTSTMPPGSPGSAAAAATTFRDTWCGGPPNASSADAGDPHLTTVNGINYDFQAAGEFTLLKNEDFFELQARQSPVLTTFTPGANPYTGLASCVSLNTAVALRIGKYRLTYQPVGGNLSPEKRMQLRLNGEPVPPGKDIDLGPGNTVRTDRRTGELDVRLADGTRVVVIPVFWTSQGYWYLDVQVFNTPAREGVLGPMLASEWLPRAPDGSSFGPKPVSLLDRHLQLNHKFADAWRVASGTSLFDYAPGTGTADFTDVNWPPESGQACTSTTVKGPVPTVREPRPDLAKRACYGIKDKTIHRNCIFDVTVMGDPSAAKGHRRADQLKAAQ